MKRICYVVVFSDISPPALPGGDERAGDCCIPSAAQSLHAAVWPHPSCFVTTHLSHLSQESLLVKDAHGIENQQGSFQEAVEAKSHGCDCV